MSTIKRTEIPLPAEQTLVTDDKGVIRIEEMALGQVDRIVTEDMGNAASQAGSCRREHYSVRPHNYGNWSYGSSNVRLLVSIYWHRVKNPTSFRGCVRDLKRLIQLKWKLWWMG